MVDMACPQFLLCITLNILWDLLDEGLEPFFTLLLGRDERRGLLSFRQLEGLLLCSVP